MGHLVYRDLEVGEVLRTTFQALFANILVIGPITALCLVPAFFAQYVEAIILAGIKGGLAESYKGWGGSTSLFMVIELLKYFAEAAVTFVVVEHLGRKVAIGHGLAYTFRLFFPIAGTALLVITAVGLGFILLLVPGIILACMMFVAVPACVVERLGPFAAIKRSIELTKGRKMPVFLVLATWFGFAMITSVGGIYGVEWVGEILRTMLFAVMGAVVYVHLRGIRDGINAVSMASVFE